MWSPPLLPTSRPAGHLTNADLHLLLSGVDQIQVLEEVHRDRKKMSPVFYYSAFIAEEG